MRLHRLGLPGQAIGRAVGTSLPTVYRWLNAGGPPTHNKPEQPRNAGPHEAYLAHRWDAFRWVFLTPMIDSCVPLFVGVDGPRPVLADLRMAPGVDPADQAMFNYGTYFLDTPAFSHLGYAIAALVAAALMLVRHEPQDIAMAGLMIAGLGFAASFFVISIACDYRYLYFLDLAALTGVLYLAIDPPWPRPTPRRSR